MAILDIPTLTDCDCRAKVYADHSGVDIEFCDLHRLAPGQLGECNKSLRQVEKRLNALAGAARAILDNAEPLHDVAAYEIASRYLRDLSRALAGDDIL